MATAIPIDAEEMIYRSHGCQVATEKEEKKFFREEILPNLSEEEERRWVEEYTKNPQ